MNQKIKIAFIINPIAGRRKHKDMAGLISNQLNKEKFQAFILETCYGGHASELVHEYLAKGVVHFVAVGGDGTVNEVAREAFKANATLGIIPCGSGNGLARTLKIPLKAEKAIETINDFLKIKMDVGVINENYFFCTCGVGFDAKIGKKFAKQKTRGFSTYVKTTIREYLRYSPKRYKIKIDGVKYARKALLITIANAGQYGNNAYIAPNASLNDGILEVCVLKPFPLIKSIILGIRLFRKSVDKSRYLEIINGRSIVFKKKKKRQFHIDGEPIKLMGPVKVDVIPSALEVITPAY